MKKEIIGFAASLERDGQKYFFCTVGGSLFSPALKDARIFLRKEDAEIIATKFEGARVESIDLFKVGVLK